MKSFKGTQTEENILTAFYGAKKESCEQISAISAEAAESEKEPAIMLFKFLAGGETSELCPHAPTTPPRTTAPPA